MVNYKELGLVNTNDLFKKAIEGKYAIPEEAGTIRIKITDLLSESLERDLAEEVLANG